MDKSEMLMELRLITEADDDDSVLFSYLEQAKNVILTRMYPYMNDEEYDGMTVPKRYEYNQLRIAAFLLNKRGAEGQTQHIENGIHRNYNNADVPEEMMRGILPRVGIPR